MIATLMMSACGNTDNSVDQTANKRIRYVYEFADYNDLGKPCSTGEQTAVSIAEYCKNLIDHSKNNFCAIKTREKSFQQYCKSVEVKWPSSPEN